MDGPGLTCPSCGKEGIERGSNEFDVPHFGRVFHYYMKCESCGFRINDFAYEGNFPEESRIEIKGKKDMNTKIVRGGNATLLVPELGLELYPGPLAESFITNVEGLLNRFQSILPLFEDKEEVKRVGEKLDEAREGRLDFSIIISDPTKVSHFIAEG